MGGGGVCWFDLRSCYSALEGRGGRGKKIIIFSYGNFETPDATSYIYSDLSQGVCEQSKHEEHALGPKLNKACGVEATGQESKGGRTANVIWRV